MPGLKDIAGAPAYNVGDRILARGDYHHITQVNRYGPGEHPQSPIINDQHAVEYVTPHGSRWFGAGYRGSERADSSERHAQMFQDLPQQVNDIFHDRRR